MDRPRLGIGSIVSWLRDKRRQKKELLEVSDPHLYRFNLISGYSHPEETIQTGERYPFELSLRFKIENPDRYDVGDLIYTVVVDYEPKTNPNRITKNFVGEDIKYNGMEEPQIAPIRLKTDLQNEVVFESTEPDDDTKTSPIDVDSKIKIKIRARGEETDVATTNEVNYNTLLADWVFNNHGIDVRRLVDNPSQLEEELTSLPSIVIGEDVCQQLHRSR